MLAALDRWLDGELGRAPHLAERIDGLDGWRFCVRLEGNAVLGTMIASADSVGRQFPLIATLAAESGATVSGAEAQSWGEAAARILATARDVAARGDEVTLALHAVPRPAAGSGEPVVGWWRAADDCVLTGAELPSGDDFARLFDRAAA